jgi:hypothetical protein
VAVYGRYPRWVSLSDALFLWRDGMHCWRSHRPISGFICNIFSLVRASASNLRRWSHVAPGSADGAGATSQFIERVPVFFFLVHWSWSIYERLPPIHGTYELMIKDLQAMNKAPKTLTFSWSEAWNSLRVSEENSCCSCRCSSTNPAAVS